MIADRARVAAALPGYELGDQIGAGAFGLVLSGRHRHLRRDVAIKVLSAHAFAIDLHRAAAERPVGTPARDAATPPRRRRRRRRSGAARRHGRAALAIAAIGRSHRTGARPLDQPLRHNDWAGAVAFSLDGRTLASDSWDKTVRLWTVSD